MADPVDNERELTGDDALRFARECRMEEATRGLFYASVGDFIRFARLVRAGWTPQETMSDTQPTDADLLRAIVNEPLASELFRAALGMAQERYKGKPFQTPAGVPAAMPMHYCAICDQDVTAACKLRACPLTSGVVASDELQQEDAPSGKAVLVRYAGDGQFVPADGVPVATSPRVKLSELRGLLSRDQVFPRDEDGVKGGDHG